MAYLVGKVNVMQVAVTRTKMMRKLQPNPLQQKPAALKQHRLVAAVNLKHHLVVGYLMRMMMICFLWFPPKSQNQRKVKSFILCTCVGLLPVLLKVVVDDFEFQKSIF